MPYLWLGVLVLFLIIEALTMGLTTIWFAVGSLIAFLVSFTKISPWVQIAVFLFTSLVLLYYTRPFAFKYLNIGTHTTNADSLIGREGIVLQTMDRLTTGQVKVWGQVWTAVSEDGSLIPVDAVVRVKAIEGVKLVVEKLVDTAELKE